MVELGGDAGVATVALLTDMNVPLGLAIGNAIEVRGVASRCSPAAGPADVVELTVALAREMLALAGVPDADVEARARRRPGDGQVARDDPRAGRRPGRAAPRREGDPHRRRGPRTACSSSSRRCRSASPRGASARDARASRTRCSTRPASDLHAKPGDPVRAGQPLVHPLRRRAGPLPARPRGARGRATASPRPAPRSRAAR